MSSESKNISELEILVMDHEQTIEVYSQLLKDHQSQIDQLRLQLERIEQKLSKYEELGGDSESDQIPPHY